MFLSSVLLQNNPLILSPSLKLSNAELNKLKNYFLYNLCTIIIFIILIIAFTIRTVTYLHIKSEKIA